MENKPTYKVEYLERGKNKGWYGTLSVTIDGKADQYHETHFCETESDAERIIFDWSQKLYGCNPINENIGVDEDDNCDCGRCGECRDAKKEQAGEYRMECGR